jgi:hypothetical protein
LPLKHQMAELYSKSPYNIPSVINPRPSIIYPNLCFWFENIASGNPEVEYLQLTMIARYFWVQHTYQNRKTTYTLEITPKHIKMAMNYTNGRKIYQNFIFPGLKQKLGDLIRKYTIWQPCNRLPKSIIELDRASIQLDEKRLTHYIICKNSCD